jgi:hypothetical protein
MQSFSLSHRVKFLRLKKTKTTIFFTAQALAFVVFIVVIFSEEIWELRITALATMRFGSGARASSSSSSGRVGDVGEGAGTLLAPHPSQQQQQQPSADRKAPFGGGESDGLSAQPPPPDHPPPRRPDAGSADNNGGGGGSVACGAGCVGNGGVCNQEMGSSRGRTSPRRVSAWWGAVQAESS